MGDDERDTPPEEPTSGADGAAESPPPAGEDAAPAAEGPAEPPAAESPASEGDAGEQRPPQPEQAPADQPPSDQPPSDQPPSDQPPAEPAAAEGASAPEGDGGAGEHPPEAERPPAEGAPEAAPARARPKRPRRRGDEEKAAEEVVPGAHLEPDLVLEDQQAEEGEYERYATEAGEQEVPAAAEGEAPEAAPVARTPMELAADARYRATGKRKTAVARVSLRPGEGSYLINGRALDEFFPRETLRLTARQPLEAAGYAARMDVVAKVHGGGVSAQAAAVRHGIARALVEADPNLRGELKRRGFLTRDARVKERKKAGLKKARKRPQFSKR